MKHQSENEPLRLKINPEQCIRNTRNQQKNKTLVIDREKYVKYNNEGKNIKY